MFSDLFINQKDLLIANQTDLFNTNQMLKNYKMYSLRKVVRYN
ncbi:MAG: hypothetical protein WC436_00600 [Candidatus Babeliales bacterium]